MTQPETEEEYIARIAKETGEDPADVRDVLEAIKCCAEEDEREDEN
jgi:hypothetical protein